MSSLSTKVVVTDAVMNGVYEIDIHSAQEMIDLGEELLGFERIAANSKLKLVPRTFLTHRAHRLWTNGELVKDRTKATKRTAAASRKES